MAQINKNMCMLMKLDIQKVYNKVDWSFLCKILEAFGFSWQWINLIFTCIATPKISLLINRTLEGFFNISRGISLQGDPISPFLFIILAEAFERSIKKAQKEWKIKGITILEDIQKITHLQFSDDTILPWESSEEEAQNFKEIIQNYMELSGQKVNVEKS